MKSDFHDVLLKSKRKVVIHEAYNDKMILDVVCPGDLLFFDDCLYSQYLFIKSHLHDLRSADVNCVIGFSTSIFRRDGQEPNSHAICSESHDLVHKGCYEAFANYMSVSEVKELAALDNVFLACHGDMHLRLEDAGKGKIEASRIFSIDVHAATKKLRALGLSTDIFVYPYAYDGFVAARKTLEKNGYKFVFAGRGSQRTPVESLSSDGQILFE